MLTEPQIKKTILAYRKMLRTYRPFGLDLELMSKMAMDIALDIDNQILNELVKDAYKK